MRGWPPVFPEVARRSAGKVRFLFATRPPRLRQAASRVYRARSSRKGRVFFSPRPSLPSLGRPAPGNSGGRPGPGGIPLSLPAHPAQDGWITEKEPARLEKRLDRIERPMWIAMFVAVALYQHFVAKTDMLRRMPRPRR